MSSYERVKESTYGIAFSSTDPRPMGTGLLKILKLVMTTGGTWGLSRIVFREERADAVAAAEEHLPASALRVTAPGEFISWQAVGDVVVPERFRPRIEPG